MDHGGATVRGYVVGSEDARAEPYDVLIADDVTSFLTPRIVEDIRRQGRRVIGVFDPDEADGSGKRRLVDLGVDDVVATDAGVEAMLGAIVDLAGPFIVDDPRLEELRGELASDPARHAPPPAAPLIAVAGAGGGVGATEVAIQIAAALRRQGRPVVLVDADDLSPSIAQRLGLPVHPNIRSAVDRHHQRSGQIEDSLHVDERLGVEILAGLPSHRSWQEQRPEDVLDVIDALRRSGRTVVANVAPHVGGGDGRLLRGRFALAGSVVGRAATAIVVGRPTPVGCRRIVDWLADARSMGATAERHVVVNGHGGGSFVTGEIAEELRRSYAVRSLHVAPTDTRLRKAAWQGTVPTRGGFARAIGRLARSIELVEAAS
jgi:hypothetical protein